MIIDEIIKCSTFMQNTTTECMTECMLDYTGFFLMTHRIVPSTMYSEETVLYMEGDEYFKDMSKNDISNSTSASFNVWEREREKKKGDFKKLRKWISLLCLPLSGNTQKGNGLVIGQELSFFASFTSTFTESTASQVTTC